MNPLKRRLHVGVPIPAERFPALLVQRRHRRRRAGVEDDHCWAQFPEHGFGQPRIGGIARNDRDTTLGLECREAGRIARHDGHVGVTCHERLHHAEAKAAATADDEHALLCECLHDDVRVLIVLEGLAVAGGDQASQAVVDQEAPRA